MATLTPPKRPLGLPPRYTRSGSQSSELGNIEPKSQSPLVTRSSSSGSLRSKSTRSTSRGRRSGSIDRSQQQNRDASPSLNRRRSTRGRSPGPSNDNGAIEVWSPVESSVPSSEGWSNPSGIQYEENDRSNTISNMVMLPPLPPPRSPTSNPNFKQRPPLSQNRRSHLQRAQSMGGNIQQERNARHRHRSLSPAPQSSSRTGMTEDPYAATTRSGSSRRLRSRSHTPNPLSRQNSKKERSSSKSKSRDRSLSRGRSIVRTLRGSGTIKEKLFGDDASKARRKDSSNKAPVAPESILPRTLLTSSVFHNPSSDLWITTINTNPKSEGGKHSAKYLRAFSYATEREAKESALANAPPRMLNFDDYPYCFICHAKFAIFRRAHHCRNCGVCICNSCSTNWQCKMVPDTFNVKSGNVVNVCTSCDWLSKAFKQALTKGEMNKVLALYSTGNLNLRCSFKNVNGETMYPVHSAVEGGNLEILKWLVDVHFCPIRTVQTGTKKNPGKTIDSPILTSKGRSVISIAMEDNKIDILRYLVVEKKMSIYETKDLKLALGMLDSVLKSPSETNGEIVYAQPENTMSFADYYFSGSRATDDRERDRDGHRRQDENQSLRGYPPIGPQYLNNEANRRHHPHEIRNDMDNGNDSRTLSTVPDACILCYENSIDCVITPCGHQICCLRCSESLNNCPVCNSPGSFIRIYKP